MVRHAELQHKWNAAMNQQRESLPLSVEIDDDLGLLPEALELSRAVTIFAGLNGVGKTRLFRLLNESLGTNGRLISLHDLCAWISQIVTTRPDLGEVTEEASPLEIDRETLDAVKAIVRRDYDEVLWYAADFADSPFEAIVGDTVIPYFVVTDGDAQYGMADMGLGELAAHVLLWLLLYLRNEQDLVLLLDEPDAYFPPSSRESLIGYLGSMALVRGYTFAVTTHSRELIDRGLDDDGVLAYIERVGPEVQLLTDRGAIREVVRTSLYPEDVLRVVGWVEDEAAYAFTLALLREIDRTLLRSTQFYWVRGAGDLESVRERLVRPAIRTGDLELIFLWDGDQTLPDPDESRWPAACLPGGADPDQLYLQHAVADIEFLAHLLDLSPEVLRATLEANAGQDRHDWTQALVDASDLTRAHTLRALARATIANRSDLVATFKNSLAATDVHLFRSLE